MKKIKLNLLISLSLILLMSISIVSAQNSLEEIEHSVDLDSRLKVSQMSLFDKIRTALVGLQFTVIGDATCSINPDYSKTITATSEIFCYTNTAHKGVAITFHDLDWQPLGQIKVIRNQEQCFPIHKGSKYYVDYYYCDDTLPRSCFDSDGGLDPYTKGIVTSTVGATTAKTEDRCISSIKLQEVMCDKDNSVTSTLEDCICENGKCTSQRGVTIKEPSISMGDGDIKVSNNGNLIEGQTYEIVGKAYVSGVCKGCIIESGLEYYGVPFTIQKVGTTGACDDSKTVGVKFDAEDEWVIFTLKDKATKTGRYRVAVNSYNGCYATIGDNIKQLASAKFTLNVEAKEVEPEPKQDPITPNEVNCYYCEGNSIVSGVFVDNCPEGTYSSESFLSCKEETPIICANNPDSPSCQPQPCIGSECDPQPCIGSECGIEDSETVKISGQTIDSGTIVIDQTLPPPEPTGKYLTYGMIAFAVVLVGVLGYLLIPKKKKKKGGFF